MWQCCARTDLIPLTKNGLLEDYGGDSGNDGNKDDDDDDGDDGK
jgi:hypothetical protein